MELKKLPQPISFADYCPPPQTFANWNVLKEETKVKKGETAFQTVKRFRLAEKEKNAAAQRLWTGMKSCRAKQVQVEVETTVRKKQQAVSDILAGGL